MKTVFLAAFVSMTSPVLAESPALLATWGSDSGSLPPEFAWDIHVEIYTDRSVSVRHCKGYAQEEPGCATVRARVSKKAMAELEATLDAAMDDLVADPPQATDDPPVGGGASFGTVSAGESIIRLPAYPVLEDANRVGDLLRALKEATPASALRQAESRAKND